MTAQQGIYTALTALLPVLGLILPGIIKNDGLSAEQNSLITFGILLLTGSGQAWSANQLGVNPWLDFVAVEAAMSSLLGGPLKPIDAFIQANIGLVSAKPAVQPQTQIKYTTQPLASTESSSQVPK